MNTNLLPKPERFVYGLRDISHAQAHAAPTSLYFCYRIIAGPEIFHTIINQQSCSNNYSLLLLQNKYYFWKQIVQKLFY